MKARLLTLLAATALLGACDCGDIDEATTSGQGAAGAQAGLPEPGSAADFVTHVEDRVFYGFDKYTLSPESRKVLEEQAAWLLKYPHTKVEIAGYCDERGSEHYNDVLGQHRADAARDYLVTLGVTADRIMTVSYGKRVTLVPGNNEHAWAQNRTAITVIR